MKTGVDIFQTKTSPNITLSKAELKYQNEVLKAKGIPNKIKAELLGFAPYNVPDYISGEEAYRKGDPNQLIKNYKTAQSIGKDLGTGVGVSGDLEGKSTDSLIGVEDEVITPDMTPITNIENITGKGLEGVSYGTLEPYYETSDSDDDYDADSQSMGDTGFDGGGGYATAYGGRIGMSNGGFASKVETIKGVGLIKPEKTFMDTDVVDDRFAFDAEGGDYIVNGPASDKKKSQINTLVNYAVDELKKEGVDIRVGNPKIKNKDKVPLITASSETYIPRIIAEKIGYPVLDALNNTGKSQVRQLKTKLDNDEPSDKSKYQAFEGGSFFSDNRKGTMLFNQPQYDVTTPNLNKAYSAFVPGVSDEPILMKPDDERFFGDFTLGNIKKAIFEKEMKGYKDRGYIFTGVRPKRVKGKLKGSSAFGTMQITYSTLEDFIKRGQGYKNFSPELKKYTKDVAQQGRDKVNLEIHKALYRDDKKIPLNKVSKKIQRKLGRLKQGVIPQEVHEKYYDTLADAVIRQKLKDYKNKGINEFLKSYGEGQEYADDVENILLDKIQFVDKKDLEMN